MPDPPPLSDPVHVYACLEGWEPHKPDTWKARFGTIVGDHPMRQWAPGGRKLPDTTVPAGTRVQIVMVSRHGHVGVTQRLHGHAPYELCLYLDQLTHLSFDANPPADA